MLLVTGGAPSGFVVALSFCIGTAFVAWSEQRRITKMRVPPLSNSSEGVAKNIQRDETSEEMYVVGFVENPTLIRLLDPLRDKEITIKISWESSKAFCRVVAIPTTKIVSIETYYRHRKDLKAKEQGYEKGWDKKDMNENEQSSYNDWDQEDWDENDDYSIMIIK
jgi:hypothetical protein